MNTKISDGGDLIFHLVKTALLEVPTTPLFGWGGLLVDLSVTVTGVPSLLLILFKLGEWPLILYTQLNC